MAAPLKLSASVFLIVLASCFQVTAAEPLDFYADALLRYEDDYRNLIADRRERIRFTGHAGVRGSIDPEWSWNVRASTGLRDRQNVPAVTLKQFTDQPYPDRNIFIDRAYVSHKGKDSQLWLGKIPWVLNTATSVFWDSDLAVYGASAQYRYSRSVSGLAGLLKPLDGNTRTTGTLNYVGVNVNTKVGAAQLSVTPWLVDFSGDGGTEYANRDVEFDHRSLRLSTVVTVDKWQYGLDLGRALSSFDAGSDFSNEKNMIVGQLTYGSLKSTGSWRAMARYLYVERFGVIKEFAQNSSSRFETSNYQGLELRFRRQMGSNWWLGTRFADTRTIAGDRERGRRFRIEAKFYFD